jgi:hypothetical protein
MRSERNESHAYGHTQLAQAESNTLTSMTDYDDGRVACTDQGITIRHYYFPAGPKHIPYQAIREVRQVPMSFMGKARILGSGDFIHWFNFDPKRPRKKIALIVHLDGRIRPVMTPDDPDRMIADLRACGVNVTTGHEAGAI